MMDYDEKLGREITADNARQSEFYKHNPRVPAVPDEDDIAAGRMHTNGRGFPSDKPMRVAAPVNDTNLRGELIDKFARIYAPQAYWNLTAEYPTESREMAEAGITVAEITVTPMVDAILPMIAELQEDLRFKRRSNAKLATMYEGAERDRQAQIKRLKAVEALCDKALAAKVLGSSEGDVAMAALAAVIKREALEVSETKRSE